MTQVEMLTPYLCFVVFAALIALTYLRMKPLKIYERSFSWLWKMPKDSRGWIKRPLPRGGCSSSKSCLHFCICLTDSAETRAESNAARGPGAEPLPPTPSRVAFLHFPPPISNWLMCILITFQEDLFYLCCASVGQALNKYFPYFIMTANGINHSTGIVLQLMFTF